jgi:hypothetical protein
MPKLKWIPTMTASIKINMRSPERGFGSEKGMRPPSGDGSDDGIAIGRLPAET